MPRRWRKRPAACRVLQRKILGVEIGGMADTPLPSPLSSLLTMVALMGYTFRVVSVECLPVVWARLAGRETVLLFGTTGCRSRALVYIHVRERGSHLGSSRQSVKEAEADRALYESCKAHQASRVCVSIVSSNSRSDLSSTGMIYSGKMPSRRGLEGGGRASASEHLLRTGSGWLNTVSVFFLPQGVSQRLILPISNTGSIFCGRICPPHFCSEEVSSQICDEWRTKTWETVKTTLFHEQYANERHEAELDFYPPTDHHAM